MSDKKEIHKKREQLVVKDNFLIENGGWNFGVAEQKIICLAISKIQPTDKDLEQLYVIPKEEYCKINGIDMNGFYTNFKKQSEKILKNFCYGQIGNKIGHINFLTQCMYNKDTGNIEIKFHSELKEHLLGLTQKFTAYELINILELKSRYSIRLYELLLANEYKQELEMDLNDLREILVADGKYYNEFKTFNSKILKPSIEEISLKTNIKVSYESVRVGKKVGKIRFTIHKHNNKRVKKAIQYGLDHNHKSKKSMK